MNHSEWPLYEIVREFEKAIPNQTDRNLPHLRIMIKAKRVTVKKDWRDWAQLANHGSTVLQLGMNQQIWSGYKVYQFPIHRPV
jgi:hypothetical protein